MHEFLPEDAAELLSFTSRELPHYSPLLALGFAYAEREFGYRSIRKRKIASIREYLAAPPSNALRIMAERTLPSDIAGLRASNRDPWARYRASCVEGLQWTWYLPGVLDLRQAGAVLVLAVAIYHDGPQPHPTLPEFLQAPGPIASDDYFRRVLTLMQRERLVEPEFTALLRRAWERIRAVPASGTSVETLTGGEVRPAPLPGTEQRILDILRDLPKGTGLTAGELATEIQRRFRHVVSTNAIYKAISKLIGRGYEIENGNDGSGYFLGRDKR